VYISDMKLRVADDLFYYPGVMVVCTPDDPYTEDEPCLVVEVASPNTETTDRREKLAAYKKMSSLRTYLIVAQDARGSSGTGAARTASGGAPTSLTRGARSSSPAKNSPACSGHRPAAGSTAATAGRVRCPVRFG
jgi:hypothetical protein